MNSIDPIIDKDEEPLFIKCDCGSEMFEIRYSIWESEFVVDRNFNLTMWYMGKSHPMTFKERLRWCWRILRTGDPWGDGIIVSENTAKKISEYINKYTQNKNEK
jgi:hypothetical protein